ncbi:amphoterin-induced protein 2-like [Brachionichthys hirsutus]|uniref:amphoterin-induced protein 2-like n=1 Tax=Brachionichthys hirsutus TaxID=412623 RepID=UPI00360485F6
MHPSASPLICKTNIGGSGCSLAAAALLFSLSLGLPLSVATCPSSCLCASDIVSCSGHYLSALPSDIPSYATRLDLSHNVLTVLPVDWSAQTLGRLVALVLRRNDISNIESNAFAATPRLLHLDLSSNRLAVLNSSVFAGLKELKELLLFGNQITQIDPGAFSDLHSLQRLYLSGNRLVAFPLGLYWEPEGPRNLSFLDVSYNRLSKVPVQSLLSLTQHGDIYVHGNPLVCDCALLALLQFWMWKQYRPLVDVRGEYPCRGDSGPGSGCSQLAASDMTLEVQTYQTEPAKWLRVLCPGLTSAPPTSPVVFWVTPRTVVNSSTNDPNSHLVVFPNGTLEIQSALMEDSGVYACVTARRYKRDPGDFLEVRVTVGNVSAANGLARRSSAEHFNTAFTTLASCVVSIILVLLYLYLTPCRCRDTRSGASRGCGGRAIALCSDPREVESGHRQPNGKRVAFLEPQEEDCNIGVPKTPAMDFVHVTTEGILKNVRRAEGQAPSDPAHVA